MGLTLRKGEGGLWSLPTILFWGEGRGASFGVAVAMMMWCAPNHLMRGLLQCFTSLFLLSLGFFFFIVFVVLVLRNDWVDSSTQTASIGVTIWCVAQLFSVTAIGVGRIEHGLHWTFEKTYSNWTKIIKIWPLFKLFRNLYRINSILKLSFQKNITSKFNIMFGCEKLKENIKKIKFNKLFLFVI